MSDYYLTDYDIPMSNPSRRVTFYRARKNAIKAAVKESGCQVVFSSQSVVITDDRQLADRISELGKIFDATASHVYAISQMELVSGFDRQEV